ncbi:hypothetical protein [Vibrio sp. ZF57]|uniref:hypothetical protein n=1 Tax=Vibrio sp. ZF57 TaxID=1840084 RepID=UPI00080E9C35|nr:hypothetical protein [Vibrio sp. ZF57]OCH51869.1 hypothetical protein A6D97_03075 [Vibrio sp. ZF57]
MDSNLSLIKYYRRRILTFKNKLDNIDPESSDLQPLLEFQSYLTKQIVRDEKRLKRRKDELVVLKRGLRDRGLGKSEARALKELIERRKESIAGNKYLLYLWRCFGDGLVFKFISKWNLKRFLYEADSAEIKQKSGYIHGKNGIDQELALLMDAFKNNVPAILCDLTNVIRHGDLCLLGDSDPVVIEVKSSKNRNKRVERQLESINKLQKYLEEDVGDVGGVEGMRRVELHDEERHHGEAFNKALELSKDRPYAKLSPEKGLYYLALNTEYEKDFAEVFEGIEAPIVYMLNQAKTEQRWDNYYPFVLSIKDPVNLYRFIVGEVYVFVAVSSVVLKEMASDIGYDLEISEFKNEGFVFSKSLTGCNEPFRAIVSEHFSGRLGLEFLTLEWFFENEKKLLGDMEATAINAMENA